MLLLKLIGMHVSGVGAITFDLAVLKGQCQGHSDFEGLCLVKEPI